MTPDHLRDEFLSVRFNGAHPSAIAICTDAVGLEINRLIAFPNSRHGRPLLPVCTVVANTPEDVFFVQNDRRPLWDYVLKRYRGAATEDASTLGQWCGDSYADRLERCALSGRLWLAALGAQDDGPYGNRARDEE